MSHYRQFSLVNLAKMLRTATRSAMFLNNRIRDTRVEVLAIDHRLHSLSPALNDDYCSHLGNQQSDQLSSGYNKASNPVEIDEQNEELEECLSLLSRDGGEIAQVLTVVEEADDEMKRRFWMLGADNEWLTVLFILLEDWYTTDCRAVDCRIGLCGIDMARI